MVRPSLSETPQVVTLVDSVSGLPPLSRLLILSTVPKTKRDSICQDQSWQMLIFKESFKPMKSRLH